MTLSPDYLAMLANTSGRLRLAQREAADLADQRNKLIRLARKEGVSLRTIAEAAGMSHTNVATIVASYPVDVIVDNGAHR